MSERELTLKEMNKTMGGGFLSGILGGAAFHVLKEAYNDWDAHIDAFREGMEAAK